MRKIMILVVLVLCVGFLTQVDAKERQDYRFDSIGDQVKIFFASEVYQYFELEKKDARINYQLVASNKSIKGSTDAIPKEIWISQGSKPDYRLAKRFARKRTCLNDGFYIMEERSKLSIEISLNDWDKITLLRDECNKKFIIHLEKGERKCEYKPDLKQQLVLKVHCGVLIPLDK